MNLNNRSQIEFSGKPASESTVVMSEDRGKTSKEVSRQNQYKCGGYYIDIGKEESVSNISLNISMYANIVVLISSNVLGQGDDVQGSALMDSFLYALTRLETVPSAIILINSGVFLASEGSPTLTNLMLLEARGVEILSNSSCLDYYKLREKLKAGRISNMFSISEKLFTAARVITL